jgi:hypothetical protein
MEKASCKAELWCRLAGGGSKPPNGAAINSCGTERLGNDIPRVYQVWIKELNKREPLKRRREVATLCQKLRSMRRSEKISLLRRKAGNWLLKKGKVRHKEE